MNTSQLTKWEHGKTSKRFGDEGILLIDGNADRILSIRKNPQGEIVFLKECDACFSVAMSKEGAIEALEEAIAWIKSA